ncbi:MAG: hypothetical protein ACK515_17945 [bacterium]|jgi:hypothetical protein|nr:hypothetical protein [Betaproteobacteria bacterium]
MIYRRGLGAVGSVGRWVTLLLVSATLMGCAAEIVRMPTTLSQADPATARRIEIGALTTIELASGFQRTLLSGSRWRQVGTVTQGEVFRSEDSVFSIAGANTHEAYLVINDERLVGFYLPGERAYSALPAPLPLRFR